MHTPFFSSIASLQLSGSLRLAIQSQATGEMIVSVLLTDEQAKDKALNMIPPLVLRGSAAELDEGFFPSITVPMQQTSALITNTTAYEEALNKAQKETRQEKDKSAVATKEKETRKKKYDEQMKKVEDLEKQKKIGEAIGQLPDCKTYPEFAEEIKRKAQQLRSQHGTLSLFEPSESIPAAEPTEESEQKEDPEEEPEDVFDDDNDDEPESFDEQ